MDFLKELEKLRAVQPRISLLNVNSEDSAYLNYAGRNKGSYMCSSFWDNEIGYYCFICYHNLMIADCDLCDHCELCYECINCRHLYNCDFCEACDNCSDSKYLFDCRNCKDCFLCGYSICSIAFLTSSTKKRSMKRLLKVSEMRKLSENLKN